MDKQQIRAAAQEIARGIETRWGSGFERLSPDMQEDVVIAAVARHTMIFAHDVPAVETMRQIVNTLVGMVR